MLKVELEDGSEIYFATTLATEDFAAQGGHGEKAVTTLKQISTTIGASLKESISNILSQLGDAKPEELKIEVGVSLNAKAGVVFASTEAGGSIKVTATWK